MHRSPTGIYTIMLLFVLALSLQNAETAGRGSATGKQTQQHEPAVNSDASKSRQVSDAQAATSKVGVGAMLCYVDTAEYFAQAWAVPTMDVNGDAMSCYSFDCTSDGHDGCYSSSSHGWEPTKKCEDRRNNPAFSNVVCCNENGCNIPTDLKRWTYIGPALTDDANLSCYFNGLPGIPANQSYSIIHGPWSADPLTHKGYACARYQALHPITKEPLASWTYSAVELASCDHTTGKLGSGYSDMANISTSLCCRYNDCNAPDQSFDASTQSGPTATAALREGFTAKSSSYVMPVVLEKGQHSDDAIVQRSLLAIRMNEPAVDDTDMDLTFLRKPLTIDVPASNTVATPDTYDISSTFAADSGLGSATQMLESQTLGRGSQLEG